MSEIARRMMTLFRGHEGASGTHGLPTQQPGSMKWEIKTTARTLREPVTEALWDEHLEGRRPLGVITINEQSQCWWGSIDYDVYDENPVRIVEHVEKLGLPLVPCLSKSGGLHLFLFLREAQPAADTQALLVNAAAALGISGCEIFPKQTEVLTERGDVGNWMVMPYFGDTYGGKIKKQHGLKKTGATQTVKEFLSRAEDSRLSAEDFRKLVGERLASRRQSRSAAGDGPTSDNYLDMGPPCLQHIFAQGRVTDGRKRVMFHTAIFLRRAFPGDWRERLDMENRDRCEPPLPVAEITGIVRSLERKEYEYTCGAEPMCSHCESVACRSRKFGVGVGGAHPVVSGITKVQTEPVIWFVDVEGGRVECSTAELWTYTIFCQLCLERTDKCFRSLKQDNWLGILQEAMKSVQVITPPPDVARGGRFHELVEEFLTNRRRGRDREDLLAGRPWHDEEGGRHYFRMRDFQTFLVREGVRDVNRAQISRRVEDMGGLPHRLHVKTHMLNVWWIPSDRIQDAPVIDTPRQPREPI